MVTQSANDITPSQLSTDAIWELLSEITDPEIPVLSITDLGIVRDVAIQDNIPVVIITPTYSGCPAMDMITMNIRLHLTAHGYHNVKIISVLAPAWTTDWMSEPGKVKLKEYGIAAPNRLHEEGKKNPIQCPQCESTDTRLISQFGSTACKALYQCNECKEPFDYFKCH